MISTSTTLFDFPAMQARKEAYYAFVRAQVPLYFNPDGTYKPGVEHDLRITHWLFPVLIASEDPEMRAFALRFYDVSGVWNDWNIFTTSSIAAALMRERERMPAELIRRSEEHLAKFTDAPGTVPSSGANDYMFHGYNDNMPAMAARNLVFAGEILRNPALLDHGLFRLEGLCAHFERRGLLSEYNSGTYTPITLTSLLDIAECAQHPDARAMAQACSERILLDILTHWHPALGCSTGPKSRAYLPDADNTVSIIPALMWYLSGDPRIIDPMQALSPEGYGITLHHGPSPSFMMANFAEVFTPSYTTIRPEIIAYARQPRSYPSTIAATSDAGAPSSIQTRTYQQRRWALGTASCVSWSTAAGHNLTLHGVLQARESTDWRGRVSFWHYLVNTTPDLGERVIGDCGVETETTSMQDPGKYHTLQQEGSAMVLGHLGTSILGKSTDKLTFMIAFSLLGTSPDEIAEDDAPLEHWSGETDSTRWQFLRFGDVYVGLRAAGMLKGERLPVRRCLKDGYLRLEIPVIDGVQTTIDADFRQWLDLGYVLEIADREECGSFAEFRRQCLATHWECYHAFYRNSRYTGRHGELHLIDCSEPDNVRFMTIDGQLEGETYFSAPGLTPELVRLFPDGRVIRQRRLLYRPAFAGSPFYASYNHVLAE